MPLNHRQQIHRRQFAVLGKLFPIQNSQDRFFQRCKVNCRSIPDCPKIKTGIFMGNSVTHIDDLQPRNFKMLPAKVVG
jgi:hypothetical protein